ncbi:MAG: hypothetical protein A2V77_04255 [Anaeromyxobacter sp. RBG_16_69_14]|nr:MAG: hypothetical protein A2V77_04255 [Anaeromyxobacter sp. RBG_16_69_14]
MILPGAAVALFAAALAVLACGGSSASGDQDPHPTSVEPGAGNAGAPTPVTIRGEGFLALTVTPAAGGAQTDARHRAWLAGVELQDVAWIDLHTLRATVPPGLPFGPQPLVVENAFGSRGQLDGAFVVTGGALGAQVAASQPTVSVGQGGAFKLTVKNTGVAPLAGVVPGTLTITTTDGAAATIVDGPSPALIPLLGPNEEQQFTWNYLPSAAGQLSILASATAYDDASKSTVSAANTVPVAVQPAAALTAAISVAPTLVGIGETIAVHLTVTNSGGSGAAGATNVTPVAPVLTSPMAKLTTGPEPSSIASLAAGASATFTWTYVATGGGSLGVSTSASGGDANSGAVVRSGSMAAVVAIQQLTADLTLEPLTVAQGERLTVTMAVTNPGDAPILGVRPSQLDPAGSSGTASRSAGPSPQEDDVPAHGTREFVWTYVNEAPGRFRLSGGATGTGLSGSSVTAPVVTSNEVTFQ